MTDEFSVEAAKKKLAAFLGVEPSHYLDVSDCHTLGDILFYKMTVIADSKKNTFYVPNNRPVTRKSPSNSPE